MNMTQFFGLAAIGTAVCFIIEATTRKSWRFLVVSGGTALALGYLTVHLVGWI